MPAAQRLAELVLYVQHVHYDITIDRADVVVARTNLLGRQNNMCKKQHLLFDTYVINAYFFSIGSTHTACNLSLRTYAIKYVLSTYVCKIYEVHVRSNAHGK